MTTGRRLAWIVPLVLLIARPAATRISEQDARDAFREDVHAAAGLTCAACHGQRRGTYAIARTAIAPLCAKCHSNAAYMKKFDPQARTDQYAQYLTSTHGRQMAAGETRVATCSDCHGAHGVRKVSDSRSPVYPTNVARTCATCHADPERMEGFGIPATPYEDWLASVHAEALLKRGDLSAPTCSTCHGSHGATPPGVTAVASVCAQCHVREAELFRASPKQAIFDAIGQPECLACHGNHRIERPTDAWVGLEDPAVCATCHDASMNGADTIRAVRSGLDQLSLAIHRADEIVSRAERAGMLVDGGEAALGEAREHQIHARVLVHAFATAPFRSMAARGVKAAHDARAAGGRALDELQVRRRGLLVATILILAFLATLEVKIRRLSARRSRESRQGG